MQTSPPHKSASPIHVVNDFVGYFILNRDDICNGLALLDNAPNSAEGIEMLVNNLHSLQDNCVLGDMDELACIVAILEKLCQPLGRGAMRYSVLFGEFLRECMDDIEDILACLQRSQNATDKQYALAERLTRLQQLSLTERQLELERMLLTANTASHVQSREIIEAIAFYRTLSEKLDNITTTRFGTTEDMLMLVRQLNHMLGHPLDDLLLSASMYVHDIGMLFVPPNIVNKAEPLTPDERQLLRDHVNVGADLLLQMKGDSALWTEASIIVRQHHEQYDGSGYPLGLHARNIHPGAMIVAIADAYFAIKHKQYAARRQQPIAQAMAEINQSAGSQFDPVYVEAFNQVIRRYYLQ